MITGGKKALEILMSQELLKNITYLINNSLDREIKHEALRTLDIIIEKKWNELNDDERHEIWKCVCDNLEKNRNDVIALQSFHRIFTCCAEFSFNSSSLLELLSENLMKLESNESLIELSLDLLLHLYKRDIQCLAKFLEFLIQNKVTLSSLINEHFANPKSYGKSRKFLSFTSQILMINNPIIENYLQYDNIPLNLKIPKIFEF